MVACNTILYTEESTLSPSKPVQVSQSVPFSVAHGEPGAEKNNTTSTHTQYASIHIGRVTIELLSACVLVYGLNFTYLDLAAADWFELSTKSQ